MMTRSGDPRLKLATLLVYTGSVLLIPIQQFISLAILVSWLVVSMVLNRINPLVVMKKVIRFYPMILLVTITIPFTRGAGGTGSDFLFFKINAAGLSRFTELNLRWIFILFATSIFGLITSPRQFLSGLQAMGLARWIVAIGFLVQRYLYLIRAELHSQFIAFRGRYIRLAPRQRLRYAAWLLAAFMVRLFQRSERVYQAMWSRGFNGHLYVPADRGWTVRDTLVFGLNLFFAGLLFISA